MAVGGACLQGAQWERYGQDWQYWFECMLAPCARQVASSLERLNLVPMPTPKAASSAQGGLLPRCVRQLLSACA